MQIKLNGDTHALAEGSTVETLVGAFKLDQGKVAVELNLAIVPRSAYSQTVLRDGDTVEIVRFIGGG